VDAQASRRAFRRFPTAFAIWYVIAMPRLREISRSAAPPDVQKVYETLFGERDPVAEPGTATGTPGNWWTVFALVPDVLRHAMAGFAVFNSPERSLDPKLRELALLRAGWASGSQFVFSQHSKVARAVGHEPANIAAIPSFASSDAYDARERAVLAFTDDLVRADGRVPEETFAALKRSLSDEAILELAYVVATYHMHAILSRALRLEYDDVPERVVEVAAPDGFDPSTLMALVRKES
jgi:alkylhydroperoxidase family enzyme